MAASVLSPSSLQNDASSPDQVILAARALGHSVSNKLALPLGVLELLEARVELPADLRVLVAAAQESLNELAVETGQFQVLVHRTV